MEKRGGGKKKPDIVANDDRQERKEQRGRSFRVPFSAEKWKVTEVMRQRRRRESGNK